MGSNYDKTPFVDVPGAAGSCVVGWSAVASQLQQTASGSGAPRTVVTVECYHGVTACEVREQLARRLEPACVIDAQAAWKTPEEIERLVEPFLGGDDRVFGFYSDLILPEWFDPHKLLDLRRRVEAVREGMVLIVGTGASHIHPGDILVYADLPRWEIQQRFRRDEIENLGADNRGQSTDLQYKRAFFVDWRVCDRWKRPLIDRWDFALDTTLGSTPKLAPGEVIRRGLEHAVTRPFRVVPFFDPAPWGGQWMRSKFDLNGDVPNYGWCFDCVPEENSLLLRLGDVLFELPSIDLVFHRPQQLLGEKVYATFGAEFPIRTDFLDTMGGGNLSFQIHPLVDYIQRRFGMTYTQDESYYMLDAGPDASVYLGLKQNVDREAMIFDLHFAQSEQQPFDDTRFVNRFSAKKHDHFLIPAGTCHCSGANSVVLEVSATPYIFTFKMWDWNRLGLDGRPRPVHLEHGLANLQWDRTRQWVEENLINRTTPLDSGPGWREERTGLHELEFIETRRHWFTSLVRHHTAGGVNVMNLVDGVEAVVESPKGQFEPFPIHYAETFIVPACVGEYTVRPLGSASGEPLATLKALVRVE